MMLEQDYSTPSSFNRKSRSSEHQQNLLHQNTVGGLATCGILDLVPYKTSDFRTRLPDSTTEPTQKLNFFRYIQAANSQLFQAHIHTKHMWRPGNLFSAFPVNSQ